VRLAVVLLVLAVTPFAPGILQGQVFFRRDVHLMWYTQVETMVAAVLEGAWPLWNPYMAFGQPLWADANTQPLYPATLLHLVLKPWTWYSLYVVLHVWLAGWGMALLLRRLRASAFASFVGGTLFMACGPLLSLVDTWNQLAGAAWMPWAALTAQDALQRPSPRRIVAWSLCLAAPVLAGSPEGLFMGGALSLACAYGRFGLPATLAAWRRAARVAASAALLGALLSAGQWLPSLEATPRSARSALSADARAHWAVAPGSLPQIVLPLPVRERALGAGLRQLLFGGLDPFLPSLYLGLPACALAVAPVLRQRRRMRATYVVLVIGALAFALGPSTPLHGLLTTVFPVLQSLRYPSKAMLLVAAGWALLGGLGVDGWRRAFRTSGRPFRERIVAAVLIAAGVAAVAAATLYPLGRGAIAAGLMSLATAAALLAARKGRGPVLALGLVPIVDLQLAHHGLNPMAPRELYTHRPEILSQVEPDGGRLFAYDYFEPGASQRHLGRETPYLPARGPDGWPWPAMHALGLRQYLFPPTAGAWRVPGSFERDVSLSGPRSSDLLRSALLQSEASPVVFLRYLQAGGVRTVVSLHEPGLEPLRPAGSFEGLFPEPIRVFHVPGAVPRSYVAVGRRVSDPGTAFVSPDFDIQREVALARDGEDAAAPLTDTVTEGGPLGTSRVLLANTDRLRLDVSLTRPAYVVAVDAHDPHWSATVDGVPARIERANGAFRAVRVGAGPHVVELVYRPWPVFAGLGLSGMGALTAAGLWRRRPAAPQVRR
jgi:hypothetical protein